MNPVTTPEKSSTVSNLLSGVVGGLAVLVVGAILLATGVIDTGDTKVVRQDTVVPSAGKSNQTGGRTVADLYKAEGRGVVQVRARGVTGDSPFGLPQQGETATGSGFLVDDQGTIITNAHVVEGSNDVSISLNDSGDSIKADVKGRDPSTDLAVLKVDPSKIKDLKVLPLGSAKDVQVGDPVVAIGNPFGFQRTVTTGIVSAKQREIQAPNGFPIRNVIQTDASINPGNSGGPLLDGNGRVIGITSQIATGGSGGGSVGIGFAIPIDTAKSLLPKLKQGGKIERAYLGIEMADVTPSLARDLNLPVKRGALIQSVVPGGPAADAGLKGGRTDTTQGISAGGDLVVKVDGKNVANSNDVAAAIADKKPGDTVTVGYYRGNDKKSAKVKLGKRPNQLQQQSSPDQNLPQPLP